MTVDQLMARFDVGRWARAHGATESKKASDRVVLISCPKCGKPGRPGLWISLKTRRWDCLACHLGGGRTIVDLIMQVDRCDFRAALATIGQNLSTAQIDRIADQIDGPDVRPFDPPEIPWPATCLALGPDSHPYLRQRGIPDAAAEWFRLGWTPGGYYRDRIIFPVWWQGRMIFWAGRDTTGFEKRRKVVNVTPQPGWANAGDVLLNMDRAGTVNGGRVVLVEGLTSAAAYGPDAVASLGDHLTGPQIRRMLDYGYTHVTMAWDGEAQEQAEVAARRLAAFIPTSIASFPIGEDPAVLGWERSRAIVAAARPVCLRSTLDIPAL